MSQSSTMAVPSRGAATARSEALSALVYRSRAVKPLSPPELLDLTTASRRRNHRDNITGLMLYDNDRFFQWIEGPPVNVDRLMQSIRVDSRHTDIEVLDSQPTKARVFGDWGMKLAAPGSVKAFAQADVIEPPKAIVDDLRKRPEAAPALLVQLVPLSAAPSKGESTDALNGLVLNRKTASILKSVFLSAVVPQLVNGAHATPAPIVPLAHPRAAELAELLIATDQAAAYELITDLQSSGAIGTLSATMFEPAARALGDLWNEDFCTEFDVALGLSRLQAALRLLSAGTLERLPGRLPPPVVLIAPEPGELHRLGAALDGTVLRHAGWAPHTEYPTDDNALRDLLSTTWFDVLDLSLSPAFRREQSLPRVTETIAEARRASRNPALVVVVGGRVFLEEKTAGSAVGADHANSTALNVNRSIMKTMTATRTAADTAVPQVSVAAS